MEKYHAIAAGAVVLNAKTGEVVAMASLPDYDPNNPYNAHDKDRLNRMSAGTYEMGSTIKSFTTAMALDSGLANLNSQFDASRPLQDRPLHDQGFPRQGPGADPAGSVHLFIQHRLGERSRHGGHRRASRVPEAAWAC